MNQPPGEFEVRTTQDPTMKPGQIEYTYSAWGPQVRHGGGVSDTDIQLHRTMARQSGTDAVNQFKGDLFRPITNLFGGKPQPQQPRVGSQAYQNRLEGQKHQSMADAAFAEAQQLRQKGDIEGAKQSELRGQRYQQQSENYSLLAEISNTRNQRGDGVIAANKPLTLQERQHLARIAASLNASPQQILAQIESDPSFRNLHRNDILSDLRTMGGGKTDNQPPKFEGFILDSVLRENQQVFGQARNILGVMNPHSLLAMERGGAFLGDVLAHGDKGISSILTRVPKTPDSNGKLRFDPESLKGLIREQVADGKTSFALVDAYMGGSFAAHLEITYLFRLLGNMVWGNLSSSKYG
jgi:hypothetical protein